MLTLQNVSLSLDNGEKQIQILKDINLELEKGKMYAITGPNGSGKSSVARVIMGIHKPTSGSIIFNGEDISGLGIYERAKLGFGYAFQHPPRFKGMKVSDMLEIAMRSSKEKVTAECSYLNNIGLCPSDYLERILDSSLSGGEMKRIEIATLLALNPKVRIFDEPEAGIDLWSFEQLIDVIGNSHSPDGITVIISHQERILNMVDRIILIDDGTVSMQGEKDSIWPQIRSGSRCACRQNCRQEGEINVECPR